MFGATFESWHEYRGRAPISRRYAFLEKGWVYLNRWVVLSQGFVYDMFAYYMHQLYESYVYLVILHGKSWLHGTILLAYWYLCMGLGCRLDSVAVIPQGQWWNNVRIILPEVPRFFLGFRAGLVGQGSYTRADNCSCYLHHAFIYILSMDPH